MEAIVTPNGTKMTTRMNHLRRSMPWSSRSHTRTVMTIDIQSLFQTPLAIQLPAPDSDEL